MDLTTVFFLGVLILIGALLGLFVMIDNSLIWRLKKQQDMDRKMFESMIRYKIKGIEHRAEQRSKLYREHRDALKEQEGKDNV